MKIVPLYVYRRDDGSTFEIEQRMLADALLTCPTTGRRVERLLQPFAPRFHGPGFYSTDHRKPSGSSTDAKGAPDVKVRPDGAGSAPQRHVARRDRH